MTISLTNDVQINFTTQPVFCWNNLFTDDELIKIQDIMSNNELQDSTISNHETEYEVRRSKINFHTRNENTSWIFDRFNFVVDRTNDDVYQFNLWGYDSFQYSEYHSDDSGHYNWHQDLSFGNVTYESRKLSLVLLLNDPTTDFSGGEFQVHFGNNNMESTINLDKGSVVLFPSFLNHRVAPVKSGIRKSITLWVTGPKFK